MLNKINQAEKYKNCMTYMWNPNNKTKEHIIKQKQLQIQRTNKWLPDRSVEGEREKLGDGDKEVQSFSCKVNESRV